MDTPLRQLSHKLAGKLGQAHRFLAPDRGEPVILMYHGIIGSAGVAAGEGDHKHVGEARFREHLDLLKRYRRVVSISALVDGLLNGADCSGMVALTFDDGYLNNAEAAAPILKEYGMPASFYLATGFIGQERWVWTDRIEHVVASAPAQQSELRLGEGAGQTMQVSVGGPQDRAELLKRIKARLKTLHWEHAERETEQIAEQLHVPRSAPFGQYRFMSWEHARQLARDGFEVGAHTVNHAILSRVPVESARDEILGSHQHIVAEVGACCPTFCYPNGKLADFNEDVVNICRGTFAAALSAVAGPARAEDLFAIRRLSVEHSTTAEYLAARILRRD